MGRKKVDDKKVTVNLYIKQSVIDKYGGLVAIREHLLNSVNDDVVLVPSISFSPEELIDMFNWYNSQMKKK